MPDNVSKFMWRCAKCSCHFANITGSSGIIKQEKKCSRCKSLNILTLSDKEIFIHCKLYDSSINDYGEQIIEDNYSYPYK